MRQNQNLDILEEKTKDFEKLALVFEKGTHEVKKQARWEHWKWKIVLALVIVLGLGFIWSEFFSGVSFGSSDTDGGNGGGGVLDVT